MRDEGSATLDTSLILFALIMEMHVETASAIFFNHLLVFLLFFCVINRIKSCEYVIICVLFNCVYCGLKVLNLI